MQLAAGNPRCGKIFFYFTIKALGASRPLGLSSAFLSSVSPTFTPPVMAEKLLFCIAPSRRHAEAIMHRLEAENFDDDHISVVFPDTGALALPGVGRFIAAGPIIAALCAATDEISAGIGRGLTCLGVSAAKAKRCEEQLQEGSFLLSVHASTDEEAERAKKALAEMGAQDICSPGEPDLSALASTSQSAA
jgi:hypothetical protein